MCIRDRDKTTEARLKKINAQIEAYRKEVKEAKSRIKYQYLEKELEKHQFQRKKQGDILYGETDLDFTKNLGYDLKDTPGVNAHICTLVADNAWQEVYVHSKVTIIDDVFTVILSLIHIRHLYHYQLGKSEYAQYGKGYRIGHYFTNRRGRT